MEKIIICYSTKHLPAKKQSKIARELYGYHDASKHGKYTYERPGILTEMQHKRIKHGCFQIQKKYLSILEKFFKQRNLTIEVYWLIQISENHKTVSLTVLIMPTFIKNKGFHKKVVGWHSMKKCIRCGEEVKSYSVMRKWCFDCRKIISLEQAKQRKMMVLEEDQ